MSESGDGYFTTDVYSITGSLMWLVGSHNMKFGSEYRYYVEDASRFSTAASPQINFSNGWTRGPLDNSPASPFGQDFASFLLGLPTGGTMSRAAAYTEKSSVTSFYAHDDWRVSGNLTLNLGLRWEIEQPLTEAEGRFVSGFDFETAPPIAATAEANYARNPIAEVPVGQFAVRGGLLYPDTGGPRNAWERNLGNVMPRAGFAWLVSPKTSVRGGYGVFYDVLGTNRITVNQVGYSRDTSLTPSLDNGQTFVATLANPFPNGLLEPVGSDLGLMTNVGLGVSFPYVGNVKNPSNHRWSLGLQQELPWQFLIEATYVGAHGQNLPVLRQLNGVPNQYLSTSPVRDDATNNRLTQQVPNPFAGLLPGTGLNGANVARSQLLRLYPQFTSVQATETIGESQYHALQGRVERRMANGFTVQVAYSWSRTMIETGYLNDADTELERVISNFDRAHTFVSSGLVELPFGRNRRFGRGWSGVTDTLLGGWQVGYIFKAQSGAPLGFGNFLFADGMGVGRHLGRQAHSGSVVQRQRVQPRHQPAARLERSHPTKPVCGSAGTRVRRAGSLGAQEHQTRRVEPAAVQARVVQHLESGKSCEPEYDRDQHRARDDHGAKRSAAPVADRRSIQLLTERPEGTGLQRTGPGPRATRKKDCPAHDAGQSPISLLLDDLHLILHRLHAVGFLGDFDRQALLGRRRHIAGENDNAVRRIDVDLQPADGRVRQHLGLHGCGDTRISDRRAGAARWVVYPAPLSARAPVQAPVHRRRRGRLRLSARFRSRALWRLPFRRRP